MSKKFHKFILNEESIVNEFKRVAEELGVLERFNYISGYITKSHFTVSYEIDFTNHSELFLEKGLYPIMNCRAMECYSLDILRNEIKRKILTSLLKV